MTRITGTLHEDLCTFMIISRWIILRMRMFETEFVEKTKTHILHSITGFFFFCENRAIYDMWKIMVQPDRLQMAI